MGLMTTLRDWFGPIEDPALVNRAELQPLDTRASLSGMIPGWSSGKPTWPTDNVLVMTRDGYRKCVTAFACINIISDAVAEATLRVWLDQGSGKRDEIKDHALRQLMQRPNPQMSESELLTDAVRIAAITGYCVLEKVRSRAGNVVQLGILRPDYVKPILRDQLAPNWEYIVPGEPPAVLQAEDAVVFTYMGSPLLDVTGDTPLRAVLREAGILNELTDFVKLLLERGGMPQIALVVDSPKDGELPNATLTDEERELIRQQFIAKYSGYRNWVGPAIVEGMRVEQIGFDLNQMAFKDLRNSIDLDVCSAFRVPPPLVQVMAGLTTSYGKTLEESQAVLQQYTANPLRARLDGAFTRSLLPEFDPRPNVSLEFDTSQVDALQEDEDAVHTRAREDLRAGGITVDQFRQRIGEDPLGTDLGNSLLLPFNIVPTPVDRDLTTSPKETPPKDSPPDGEVEDDERMEKDFILHHVEDNGKGVRTYYGFEWAPTGRVIADVHIPRYVERDGRKYLDARSLSSAQKRAQANIVGAHRGAIVGLAKVVEPKIATYLQEQKGRVIEAVTGVRSLQDLATRQELEAADNPHQLMATRAIEELDWASEEDQLLRILRSWLDTVGEAAFEEASALIGQELSWDVADPYLSQLHDLLGRDVVGITDTTRTDLERIITEALLEGTSMPDLAGKIEHLFDETYSGRAMTISRTESQVAYNAASQTAYETSGVVAEAQLHDNSSHTEAYGASDGLSCAERDGLIVPVSRISYHASAEHPNGTMACSPIVQPLEGE